ncbi:MAG: PEGA domain-containing protein [bacterium]
MIFIIGSPILILLARGDSFGTGFTFLQTGGIYLDSIISGSKIYLNDEDLGGVSFFQHSNFIRNLKPNKTYDLRVEKSGYNTWYGKLTVKPNKVERAKVFMLPKNIVWDEISKKIPSSTNSSTTKILEKSNPEYTKIFDLFLKQNKFTSTSSTSTVSVQKKITLDYASSSEIRVMWNGKVESAPEYFCLNEDCLNKISVYKHNKNIVKADFIPNYNDAIIFSDENNLYATDLWPNSVKTPQVLYSTSSINFLTEEDYIYIQVGNYIGRTSL